MWRTTTSSSWTAVGGGGPTRRSPEDLAARLRSHLGRGRNGVKLAKRAGDEDAVARARHRNGLAKHGLGERGPEWWTRPVPERIAQAEQALADLDRLDESP
ncbi:biopolymer transporter Tol [Curtobacterium sp. MCPF17_052]|uniref:biopolymer transporter Tol n=1 Tax=Curtobacterium sp. MCPF17_052 TaxID=2175655 RepID=UPI003463A0E6